MADASSFDVTSTIDLQEVDNAVNQARKEIAQRYDFKGSSAAIEFNKAESSMSLAAEDTFKIEQVWDILQTRLVRRNVPIKNMKLGDVEPATGSTVRRKIELKQGIDSDAAREIVKFLKEQKLKKVQTNIQGDQLRITSSSKDELQEVMRLLRAKDFGIALQFGNYR
jgi:cyclic-di-GMP-binding protein